MRPTTAIVLLGLIGLGAFTNALPSFPDPRNVLFSEYIAASMTGFFFNYVRRNNLDPTPPTTTPIDISFGNINASVNGFQLTNLTRGVFIPVLGPTCLKEKTFTVSFCVTSQSPFTNNENRFVVTANYTAEGQYSQDGDVVQDVHGKGLYRSETWEEAPFICAWVDYSNIKFEV